MLKTPPEAGERGIGGEVSFVQIGVEPLFVIIRVGVQSPL
jgi:hypothetical protein